MTKKQKTSLPPSHSPHPTPSQARHRIGEGGLLTDKGIEEVLAGGEIPRLEPARPDCAKPQADNWAHRSKGMRCATCMWFVPKVRMGSNDPVIQLAIGRCRRHSPTMFGWPVMKPLDWCGDHKLDEEKI